MDSACTVQSGYLVRFLESKESSIRSEDIHAQVLSYIAACMLLAAYVSFAGSQEKN